MIVAPIPSQHAAVPVLPSPSAVAAHPPTQRPASLQILSEDYSKAVFLCRDRSLQFHAKFGAYHSTRIPRFGRDMAYAPFNADLLIVGSAPEVYRCGQALSLPVVCRKAGSGTKMLHLSRYCCWGPRLYLGSFMQAQLRIGLLCIILLLEEPQRCRYSVANV